MQYYYPTVGNSFKFAQVVRIFAVQFSIFATQLIVSIFFWDHSYGDKQILVENLLGIG
jgi:hypothetical protein